MNPCCFAPLINLCLQKNRPRCFHLCAWLRKTLRETHRHFTQHSNIKKISFHSTSWHYQKPFSTESTCSAVVQEDDVTLRICMVSEQHNPCLNYTKVSNQRCLCWRERFKEHGLISGLCHFLLVLLFEFVVSQRGLDGVLREHWRKINSTVRQGLDNSPTV